MTRAKSVQSEAYVTPEQLERILRLAGDGMILVGGQALAFWAAYYRAPAPRIAITKDVDLLGTQEDVKRIARGLNAVAIFPHERGAGSPQASEHPLGGQARSAVGADMSAR